MFSINKVFALNGNRKWQSLLKAISLIINFCLMSCTSNVLWCYYMIWQQVHSTHIHTRVNSHHFKKQTLTSFFWQRVHTPHVSIELSSLITYWISESNTKQERDSNLFPEHSHGVRCNTGSTLYCSTVRSTCGYVKPDKKTQT